MLLQLCELQLTGTATSRNDFQLCELQLGMYAVLIYDIKFRMMFVVIRVC